MIGTRKTERPARGGYVGWSHIHLKSLSTVASALLFALTLLRMVFVVGADPIVAYANNYDFVRQSSCVGVWEHHSDGRPKVVASPDKVAGTLDYDGDRKRGVCLPSSDNFFPWAAAHLHHKHTRFTIRQVGSMKAIAAATLLLCLLLQPVRASFRFTCALAGFLLFGDLNYLLFFNTLYLDASLVIFGFFAIALTCTIFCRSSRPGLPFILLLGTTIVWLVFARGQYAGFAVLLTPVAAFGFCHAWRSRIGVAAMAICAALSLGGLKYFHLTRSEHTVAISHANAIDTVFEAVLPAATDKEAAIRQLGLPQHCTATIGLSWYSPDLSRHPCPEVYGRGRLFLLPLFLRDPPTFFKPFRNAVVASRPADMPQVAHFEDPSDANRWPFRVISGTSFTHMLGWLPDDLYAALVYASMLALLPATAAFVIRRRHAPSPRPSATDAALLLAALGGALAFFGVVSSVFGDGYADLGRHALGLDIGMVLQLAAAFGMLHAWIDGRRTTTAIASRVAARSPSSYYAFTTKASG